MNKRLTILKEKWDKLENEIVNTCIEEIEKIARKTISLNIRTVDEFVMAMGGHFFMKNNEIIHDFYSPEIEEIFDVFEEFNIDSYAMRFKFNGPKITRW